MVTNAVECFGAQVERNQRDIRTPHCMVEAFGNEWTQCIFAGVTARAVAAVVTKRVVGRDGGGGVNGGECVRCVEGGVAVAAAALRWWRWRRRRERRVGRPALAATATTMAVMEAAKEVAVKEVVRLRGSMRTRATRGEKKWASNCSTAEKGRRSHPLGAS